MDQLAPAFLPPGIGHNQPPEATDPIERLNTALSATHADFLARLRELELACARVPDPIATDEDAATATESITRCQSHLKRAAAARKKEKMVFLCAGRTVDAFFKGRCERLNAMLAPTIAQLKIYRDRVAAAGRHRHEQTWEGVEECRRALAESEAHRFSAERVAHAGPSFEERRDAAEALSLVEEAAEHAGAETQIAPFAPARIRGNCGATAFVRRSWTFEVVDLDQVPREYMSLDVPVVRAAITQDGIRHIPGLRISQTEELRVSATTGPRSQKTPSDGAQAIETSKSAGTASSDQRRGPRPPKGKGRITSSSDPGPVVSIKPIWGDQKVLRYYRQALASLQPHDAPDIAKFRAANAAIEARLWRKLPQRMEEIDFLYGGSRLLPEAGEGTPK